MTDDHPEGDGDDHPAHEETRRRGLNLLRRKSHPERKRLATILEEVAADTSRDRISITDLMQSMEGRAMGALLLIFAVPNALPAPPGTSGILGLPLLYLSVQMMLGRLPWLPRIIASRSLARKDFATLVDRIVPWLDRADRLMAPRLQWLCGAGAQQLLGLVCLVLALVLFLPIPLGNMLPAFAICLIALGVLERDGLWIVLGLIVGVLSVIIVSGVIYGLFRAVVFLVTNAF
jgi:hypothetical protein